MSQATPALGTPRPGRRKSPPGPRRPPGRPRLPDAERYDALMLARFRRCEAENVKAAARSLGETVSEFLATAALRRMEATLATAGELEADVSRIQKPGPNDGEA